MDTLGSLIDKLITVDMKMFYAQEDLYEIRKMSFEDFVINYGNEDGMRKLWTAFKKGMDLNLQRNDLIDELDQFLVKFGEAVRSANKLDSYLQLKHKTY